VREAVVTCDVAADAGADDWPRAMEVDAKHAHAASRTDRVNDMWLQTVQNQPEIVLHPSTEFAVPRGIGASADHECRDVIA